MRCRGLFENVNSRCILLVLRCLGLIQVPYVPSLIVDHLISFLEIKTLFSI